MAYDPNWDCYPLTSRAISEKSDVEYSHDISNKKSLYIDDVLVDVISESIKKYTNKYSRITDPYSKPYIEDLSNGLGTGDVSNYGPITHTITGNASDEYTWNHSTVLFMDLRHDITVIKKDTGTLQASNGGTGPAMLSVDVGGTSFGGLSAYYDVVIVDLSHAREQDIKDTVTISTRLTDEINSNTVTPVELRIGASDKSGYCGTVGRYYCLPWGTYGTVDLSKPHSVVNGELIYTHYADENPSAYPLDYYPHWNEYGDVQQNEIDAKLFESLWTMNGTNSGTYDISFDATIVPYGSITFDAYNNIFASIIRSNGTLWNKLIDFNNNQYNIAETTGEPTDTKYYPIAPL
jgi:hypothetical protein